jgi:glycosyltransferase involved in cell wall biosynthesis
MVQAYRDVDGLLFLSTEESYGFPLIEAMFMGIPVVCPDLPYAHELCSDGAIYFDPNSISSLHDALVTLNMRFSEGWWPDWTRQLSVLPKNWDVVADSMIAVACGEY